MLCEHKNVINTLCGVCMKEILGGEKVRIRAIEALIGQEIRGTNTTMIGKW